MSLAVIQSKLPGFTSLLHSVQLLSVGNYRISMIRELKGPARIASCAQQVVSHEVLVFSKVYPNLQVNRQIKIKCLRLDMMKNVTESRITLCSQYPLGSNQEKAEVSLSTEKPWESGPRHRQKHTGRTPSSDVTAVLWMP